MKRIFDAAVSAILLVLFSPVLAVVAVLVKRELGSPVLFRQERTGRNGVNFHILKFRSMTNGTDAYGNLLPDQQRLTRFGLFLRKSSLDEFPQLFSVLKGDMSLVGPRPLLPRYVPYYTERERLRHTVRPGMTGLAQVSGRNALSWEERLELDVQYVENYSFRLDLKILLLTVKKVIGRDGTVAVPSSVMLDLDEERRDVSGVPY
ncbi:putative sugar transferase EpsL [Paenibacillus sp. CECT 9249]|uniref:sugar transferase n=1 Tax=Paenibacillus sp. CECT 9249 TaxID=2845385 RepID=UPI001E5C2375|nr:sugar transferase [Paenibacillus sp. CECT 9249]CAH0119383.1 putative sugar transferase EpsL [Paenibacillus sp. CECT 9249]